MWSFRAAIFIALLNVLLLSSVPVTAQDGAARGEYTFPSRPTVSIKLRNSTSAKTLRGTLVSVSPLDVVYLDKGEEKRVSMERVDVLKTNLMEFKGSDEFSSIADTISKSYAGVEFSTDGNSKSSAAGSHGGALPGSAEAIQIKSATIPNSSKSATAKAEEMAKQGLGDGKFGGIDNLPKGRDPSKTEAVEPSEGIGGALPGSSEAASSVVVGDCSKCGKSLTEADIKRGDCPHCKTAIITEPSREQAKNPFGQGGANKAGQAQSPFHVEGGKPGAAAPVAGQGPVPSQLPPAAPAAVVQGNGFTFDSIPGWAKGGLFVLLVLVGYHVLFNR